MSHAFVLDKETLLCCLTSKGWQPLSIPLPTVQEGEPIPYQLGRVTLLESLAPNKWQSTQTSHATSQVSSNDDALAATAISYHYAQNNQLALPEITTDIEAIIIANSGTTEKSAPIHAFIPYRQLITQLVPALANQISQAIQLLRWQTDTQFCSRCSAAVSVAHSGERAMVCGVCRLRQYPRVQPCVITAITRPNPQTGEMQVLLAHHHRYGQTSLPLQYGLIAGFVEVGESLEHAVVREVYEEVGLRLTDIRYVSSQPWPFPSNLMLGFRATYQSGEIVLQEDELSHANFFDLSALPKIPFKGSIAYELIAQIAHEQGISLA